MTLVIDRVTAARLGITVRAIDNTLNLAFGQSRVSTIYQDRNQYRVIMEWHPRYAQGPNALADVYVPARGLSTGTSSTPTVATRMGTARSTSVGPARHT